MNNLKVKTKIIFLLIITTLTLLIFGLVSVNNAMKLNNSTEIIYNESYTPTLEISQIKFLMQKNLTQLLLAGYHDPVLEVSKEHEKTHNIQKHLDEIPLNAKKISELWAEYSKRSLSPQEKKNSR